MGRATFTSSLREGSWYWPHSLEPLDFSAWFPGEPDNLEGGENCAMIYGYANPEKKPFWNDYHCSHSNSPHGLLFSICQRSF